MGKNTRTSEMIHGSAPSPEFFIQVPLRISRDKRLTSSDKLVYGAVLSLSKGSKGRCTARNETLAERTGLSVIQVRRSLETLSGSDEKDQLIKRDLNGKRRSGIRVLDIPESFPREAQKRRKSDTSDMHQKDASEGTKRYKSHTSKRCTEKTAEETSQETLEREIKREASSTATVASGLEFARACDPAEPVTGFLDLSLDPPTESDPELEALAEKCEALYPGRGGAEARTLAGLRYAHDWIEEAFVKAARERRDIWAVGGILNDWRQQGGLPQATLTFHRKAV